MYFGLADFWHERPDDYPGLGLQIPVQAHNAAVLESKHRIDILGKASIVLHKVQCHARILLENAGD